MKKNHFFKITGISFLLLLLALGFTSCDTEDDPEPAEALITSFSIINAGANADQTIEGSISGMEILVAVPFETDLTQLIPEVSVSEGATVVPASGTELDFTEPRNFVVTNEDITNTYTVTVEKAQPTSGVINSITFKSASSDEVYENEIDQSSFTITITYNELQNSRVVIDDIELLPAGTTYTTTSGTDTLDLETNQSIVLSYAGEETTYTIGTNVTSAGFNPDNTTTLMDKTGNSGLTPSIINTENNRGVHFDGQFVYVASRQEGNHMYYFDVDDPNAEPAGSMNIDSLSGGAWVVSDVRVKGDYIYVSNMVNAAESVFKVYRYNGKEDTDPQVIISYTLPDDGIRLGDAISVVGNPPEDGYIFASNFAWPDNASEFYVWNFDGGEASEAEVMPIDPIQGLRIGQYGRVTEIPGEPDRLLVTGAEMGIGVMDLEGNVLAETYEPLVQSRSFDPSIFTYNGGTYLSYTVNREWESNAFYEVINITEGATMEDAILALTPANIESKRVHTLPISGNPDALFVGATNGVGFSPDGKPRIMAFSLQNGFIVQEFSN